MAATTEMADTAGTVATATVATEMVGTETVGTETVVGTEMGMADTATMECRQLVSMAIRMALMMECTTVKLDTASVRPKTIISNMLIADTAQALAARTNTNS